jgi:Uma2 family endonuclease
MSCGFIQVRTRSLKKPNTPAPDICVEVYSPANELQELIEKRAAYSRAGAREVRICDQTNISNVLDRKANSPNRDLFQVS